MTLGMNVSEKEFRYMVLCIMRDLARLLVERRGMSLKEALRTLYASDTYSALTNPATGLYYQSPLYTYACLDKEITTGKM